MNILLVDDDDNVYQKISKSYKNEPGVNIVFCKNFQELNKYQALYKLDLIILDLNNGNPALNDTEAGDSILKNIYRYCFLPVIIFSAWADDYDNPYKDNYFVRSIKKGQGELRELRKIIKEYRDFIGKQNAISGKINSHISEIYRETYNNMVKNDRSKKLSSKAEIFTHLIQRRLAASFDSNIEYDSIKPWEIYLYPPLGDQLLAGDILKKRRTNNETPSSYRVILSPSCDLQSGNNRKHIENVIVANFIPINEAVPKKADITRKLLTTSSPERYIIFYELINIIPHMACDLKSIETIKFDSIGKGKDYERILSIDSPFRESLIWSFLQINGRPGLPNRDIDIWINDIKAKYYPEVQH
jgi:CheY-like chemotaxis protein